MLKFLPTLGHFYYNVSRERQVTTFTAVRSVLSLFMPLYFFVSQPSTAEEILSSTPTWSNFPSVKIFQILSWLPPLSAKNPFPTQNRTQTGNCGALTC